MTDIGAIVVAVACSLVLQCDSTSALQDMAMLQQQHSDIEAQLAVVSKLYRPDFKGGGAEFLAALRRFGEQPNLEVLRAIVGTKTPLSSEAAMEIATRLSPGEAVLFCCNLTVNSPEWRAAFYSLGLHRKDEVIGYVKQMVTSSVPEVRYHCYGVCASVGWSDLLPWAMRDVASVEELIVPSLAEGETDLGFHARMYVERWKRE